MRVCSVAGCNNKHHAKGYCQKHYKQSQSHKSILPDRRGKKYDPNTNSYSNYNQSKRSY